MTKMGIHGVPKGTINYIEATYECTVYWDEICQTVEEDYGFVLTIDMVSEIYAKYAEIEIILHEPQGEDEITSISLGQGCFADNDYKWPLRFYVADDRYNELYRGSGDEQDMAGEEE